MARVQPPGKMPGRWRWLQRLLGACLAAAVLEILRETEGMSVRNGYRVLTGNPLPAYRAMLDSQDAREGAQAFAERRRPVWRGR